DRSGCVATSLLVRHAHRDVPRSVALPPLHMESFAVPAERPGLWRHCKLGFMFAPLARQAVLDLNVFVFGHVAQHFESWVLDADFLILSLDGVLADCWRVSRDKAHCIFRPDVYQSFRVLGQRNFNVFLMEFFNGREVRRVHVPSQKRSYSSASDEEADAEACEKRYSHEHRSASN